ncbi:hypothetical protein DL165_17665 [Escherichia coli]|nr:hypothetical protein [Escherichia coli]
MAWLRTPEQYTYVHLIFNEEWFLFGSTMKNTMVPPKGEVSVDIPHAATGDISFQTINDYGALTPRIKATMQ